MLSPSAHALSALDHYYINCCALITLVMHCKLVFKYYLSLTHPPISAVHARIYIGFTLQAYCIHIHVHVHGVSIIKAHFGTPRYVCVWGGGREGGGRDGGEGCVSVTHLCVSSLGLSSSVSTLKAGGGGVKVSQQEACIYSRTNIIHV